MLRWYLVYTKQRSERIAKNSLEEKGLEVYLPMVKVWRVRRKRYEKEPLFPNYIFVHLDLEKDSIGAVRWAPGVRYFVRFDNSEGPTVVPDEIIEYIKTKTGEIEDKGGIGQLKKGDRVRIVDGPFKDMEAIFEKHLSGNERSRILINVLGRITPTDVPSEWLEKA